MSKIKVDGYKCDKCGHTWIKRGEEEPAQCPKCRTVRWNKPNKESKE